MINKLAAIDSNYFAPSIKDLQYADKNSKKIANLLLAALGISTAGYGARYLIEGLNASRMSDEIQPSRVLQKRLREAISPVDNEHIYSTLKELEDAAHEDSNVKESSFNKTSAILNKLEQSVLDKYLANRLNAEFVDDLRRIDVNNVLTNHKRLANKLHYDPSTLDSDSLWTKYVSAPIAKWGPQSAIPLALILGGGLALAPMISKKFVKSVNESLKVPDRKSDFIDTAKKIYDDAAEELQEVGYKHAKDKIKTAKAKDLPKDIVQITRSGGNPLLSLSNLPTIAAAALLAYAAYKGVSGFDKGFDKAKNDIAHQTNFLRGWTAAKKLRDYDYNPIGAALADEPDFNITDKSDKAKALLRDLKDSDNIEYNPSEVRRLTSDYLELA